jgi:hypothetical protein
MHSSAFFSVVHILCPTFGDFWITLYLYPKICRAKRNTFDARYNTSVRLRIAETVTTKTAMCAHTLIEDSLLPEQYIMPLFPTFRTNYSIPRRPATLLILQTLKMKTLSSEMTITVFQSTQSQKSHRKLKQTTVTACSLARIPDLGWPTYGTRANILYFFAQPASLYCENIYIYIYIYIR